jgi:hypothetical protein
MSEILLQYWLAICSRSEKMMEELHENLQIGILSEVFFSTPRCGRLSDNSSQHFAVGPIIVIGETDWMHFVSFFAPRVL